MTLLQQIRQAWSQQIVTPGDVGKVTQAMGVNVKHMGQILRGKKPIPACVWEYLIANKVRK